jgi:hypothetical protein
MNPQRFRSFTPFKANVILAVAKPMAARRETRGTRRCDRLDPRYL